MKPSTVSSGDWRVELVSDKYLGVESCSGPGPRIKHSSIGRKKNPDYYLSGLNEQNAGIITA